MDEEEAKGASEKARKEAQKKYQGYITVSDAVKKYNKNRRYFYNAIHRKHVDGVKYWRWLFLDEKQLIKLLEGRDGRERH